MTRFGGDDDDAPLQLRAWQLETVGDTGSKATKPVPTPPCILPLRLQVTKLRQHTWHSPEALGELQHSPTTAQPILSTTVFLRPHKPQHSTVTDPATMYIILLIAIATGVSQTFS